MYPVKIWRGHVPLKVKTVKLGGGGTCPHAPRTAYDARAQVISIRDIF